MMDYCSEVRDFINANVDDAVCTGGCGFAVFSSRAMPDTVIIAEPVCSTTLEDAAGQSQRLSTLVSEFPDKKVVIVPEDIWRSRPDMVRKRVLAHLGKFRSVFARKTAVRRVDRTISSAFLSACHTYGEASARYRYGLFLGDEMVACASFSSPRTWHKPDGIHKSAEWVRYASLPDVRVVGGMGKILNHFIEEVRPDDVMSYADLEWTDGDVYRKLGFKEESLRPPVSFVIDPETFLRRPLAASEALRSGCGISERGCLFHVNLGSVKYRLDIP
ncbi:MAG: hypothetical protein ACI4UJ_10315 [Candidatus Cryptobacteroides sp.]